ncbi:lantibiotic transporter, partial [Streptococcus pneumoniae]|nr:lantibiotic transporter [Streptococcus pneumoniae]
TYFQLGDVVSRLLFSTLVIYLSYTYIAVIYMILVLIVAIYTFRRVQTTS